MKLTALLGLALVSVALAQGPGPGGAGPMGGFGPMGPGMGQGSRAGFTELKDYLGLTDAQITQIQSVRQTASSSIQAVMTQINDKRTALQSLLDKGTTDAAVVGKLILDINTLQKQAEQLHSAEQGAALKLLTADQKSKLAVLESASKLQQPIHEAMALGLLTPPVRPAGGPIGPSMRPAGMHRPQQ